MRKAAKGTVVVAGGTSVSQEEDLLRAVDVRSYLWVSL